MKRSFVVDSVADEFIAKSSEAVCHLKAADPLDPVTDVGPLFSEARHNVVEAQVRDAVLKRAKPEVGSKRIRRLGQEKEKKKNL